MSFFRFRLVLWPGCWHTINMHSWHQATKLHGHRPTTAMNQLAHFFVWVYPDCLVIIFLCFFYVVVRRWAAYVYILLWPGSRKVCISCAIATTKMELNSVQFYFFLGWRPNCDYPACIDALQKRTKHITVDFFRLAAYAKRVGLMSVFI